MMATPSDSFLLLGREVERLVTAPYAPSLQDLHCLVKQVPASVIYSWTAYKPCQIGPLVDVIVGGLSRSRFAPRLLASFARAKEFRDALLQRHPYLLDRFLQQAAQDYETEYLAVCISLLSDPLPSGIIPPASLAPFVMKMIDMMRQNPCSETVRPLYSISSCLQASPGVLSEIPEEVMSCFQTELTNTLRDLDDHMGNLLCLATFARLASAGKSGGQAENETHVPSWLQNIRHFFGPKRGLKTLDLVVLRVILACSSNCGNLTTEQSVESIRLAIHICDSVDEEQRQCWLPSNSIKIAKLCDKVTREGIDPSVQMLGLTFLVLIIPPTSLSPDLVRLSLDWLVSGNARAVLETVPQHCIPRLVRATAVRSGQLATKKVLDYVCSALSLEASGIADIATLQMAKLLLHGLRPADSQVCLPEFADTISEQYRDVIRKLVGSFPRHPHQSKCEGSATCNASASRAENELISDLLSFWFEATLPLKTEQEAAHSPGMATLTAFIARSTQFLPETKCMFSETKPLSLRAPFLSLRASEMTSITRGDWRSGMRETILTNARMFNENIMQKVQDICYELEQRCDNVEEPLRAAEEERNQHFQAAERLNEQNSDLENQLRQASATIAELRGDMSRLESHADSAGERVENLSACLTQARQELEELRRTSQEAVTSERESFRTRELDFIASLTGKDDRLEELQEELKYHKAENKRLTTELASMSQEKDSSLESLASLKNETSILQSELEKNTILLTQKDEIIEQLTTEKDNMHELAEDLQKKLDMKASECESLKTTVQDSSENFRAELEALKRQTELQQSEMAKESTEQKAQILSLQRAMHEAKSTSTKELQTKEKRIQHLQTKVQRLREERAAKAREFSEAQQHISRLMNVMGFKSAPTESRVLSKQRSRQLEPSQTATMDTQTNSGEGISQSREEELLATSFGSNISQSGGRSPKRSRNSAFSSAQPSPPLLHGSSRKSKDLSKSQWERRPLGEADHNTQSTPQCSNTSPSGRYGTPKGRQSNGPAELNHLEDIDLDLDLEFSKDFVFTSTSLSEFNGHTHD